MCRRCRSVEREHWRNGRSCTALFAQGAIVMTLLRNLVSAIRRLIERIRPEEVPDGNPEYL
jgi:hypothetical protein